MQVKIKLSNIGTATAYSTNISLSLGDSTLLNSSLIDQTIGIVETAPNENYTLNTQRKIIVGEPYTQTVVLSFTPSAGRRELDDTRSFIKALGVSIDLKENLGEDQVL